MTSTPYPGGELRIADRTVARIGLGVMQLGERPGRPPVESDAAVTLLRRSVELSITHFDTAEFYGAGRANQFLRQALAPFTDTVLIATKIGAERVEDAAPLTLAQKPQQLRASVEANLASLGTDRLDLVYLRRGDIQPGLIATGDQIVDLDDQLAELVSLRTEGKIGAIGLSNVRQDQVEQALPIGIASVQNAYSLVNRSGEALLELCTREGIAWVPYFPLGSAFPGVPKVTELPAVIEIAAELGVTASQVGLAWLLQHSPEIALIAGTSSVTHLEENARIGEVTLGADQVARLER